MVTRKPVGSAPISIPKPQSSTAPPYPISPTQTTKANPSNGNKVYSPDLATSPAFELIDRDEAREHQQQRARSDSDASSHGTWDSDDTDREDEIEVPKPLNVKSSQQNMHAQMDGNVDSRVKDELPASLRIGPSGPVVGQSSGMHGYEEEAQSNPWQAEPRSPTNSKNPYLKQNAIVTNNSQSAWQEVIPPPVPSGAPPPPPSNAPRPPPPPVELPAVKSPSEELARMSLHDQRPASWETAEILTVPQQGQFPLPPPPTNGDQRPMSQWWRDGEHGHNEQSESAFAPPAPPQKARPQPVEQYAPPPGPPPAQSGTLIDHEVQLSSRNSKRPAPIQTSQPSTSPSQSAVPETPGTMLQKQRNTTYQIKHINWCDSASSGSTAGLRNSPILTQNANGPCPLLALVNALVLSTPQHMNTALVDCLQTREQVSLGLLLDAVFDELMSGRRGETASALPDVSELYSFLLALHTGMNVNPRFVTPATTPRGSLDGHPKALNNVHPAQRSQMKAGAFEETREMRLYSTFNVPLIHGWTPPGNSPAYDAFLRSAETFEEAQNIQFLEAELEDKRRAEGLSHQEQVTLQDIQTIRAFLDTWPTQLTDFGLETISKSLQSGQIAILFRNDHFSTIYKEPRHGALMTLVTDTGYSSHDEIVWESLVDVNGSASEMFSGDFRPVSHGQDVRLNQGNSGGGMEGWQNVPPRNQSKKFLERQAHTDVKPTPPPLPGPRPNQQVGQSSTMAQDDVAIPSSDAQRKAAEQEDHDLALALQLQEEEENHQRQDEERRRREQQLSEQFLSNESEGPRPPIPPRRGAGRTSSNTQTSNNTATTNATTTTPVSRPAVSRPSDDPADPEAPPSYEQAWSDRPYRPAGSTAAGSMQQGNPLGAYDALRRQQNAFGPNQSTMSVDSIPPYTAATTPAYAGRRPSGASPSNVNGPPGRQRQSRYSTGGPMGPTGNFGQASGVPGGYPGSGGIAPGHFPGSYQNAGARPGQAAGVKDAEDRCTIM